jgi:6-phosphogluconolactonase
MKLNNKRFLLPVCLAVTMCVAACGDHNKDDIDAVEHHSVYTQTNDKQNQIVHFTQNTDGTLTEVNRISTHGSGTDGVNYFRGNAREPDPLTSSNSLLITPDKQRLFAVNAGSNSVSSFKINHRTGNLTLLKTEATGGVRPNSLAYHNDILYVTHQEGENQVHAYRIAKEGSLLQIGAYSLLQKDALPAHVVVSPDGKSLIVNRLLNTVTPVAPNDTVVIFPINPDGGLGTPKESSTAAGPFSGIFLNGKMQNIYLLTEAVASTLSEYTFNNGNLTNLNRIAIPVVTDPCWLQITPDNKFVFVTSASGHISSFALDENGKTTLLKVDAAFEPKSDLNPDLEFSAGIDSWVSPDGKFLYQGFGGNDSIVSYAINSDGSLTKIDTDIIGTGSKVSLQGLVGI